MPPEIDNAIHAIFNTALKAVLFPFTFAASEALDHLEITLSIFGALLAFLVGFFGYKKLRRKIF
jgi:hypothetical protein